MKQARLVDYFKENQDIKPPTTSSSRITPTILDLRNPTSKTFQKDYNPTKLKFSHESQDPNKNKETKEKTKKRKRIYGDGILSEFTKKLKLTSDQFSSLKDKSSLKLSTENDHQLIKYVKPILPKKSEAGSNNDEKEDICSFEAVEKSFVNVKRLNDQEIIPSQDNQDFSRGNHQKEGSQNLMEQEEMSITSSSRNKMEIFRSTDPLENNSEALKEKGENILENKPPKIVGKSNRGCQEALRNGKLVVLQISNALQNNKEVQTFYNRASDISSEPSIREKYEELLKTERDFVLPLSYKKLLEILKDLDMMINYFMMHQKPLCFTELTENLRKALKVEITEKHLAQIKYAALPCLYQISWMENEKKRGKWDLYIRFPNDENDNGTLSTKKLEERQVILKDGLLRITKNYHLKFLQSINAEKNQENYERQKCWNSRFRVNECPPVPEGKLPDRPDQESVVTVEEFLREGEIKNQRVKQAMEEAVKKVEKDQTEKFVYKKTKSGISEKLLLKVRAKEAVLAENKNGQNRIFQVMMGDLKRVAGILKVYFTLRDVSSMYLVQIMQHLSGGQDKCILGKDEAEKYIRELIRLCPEWLSLKILSNLHVITMNKSISMSCIYECIEKRLM